MARLRLLFVLLCTVCAHILRIASAAAFGRREGIIQPLHDVATHADDMRRVSWTVDTDWLQRAKAFKLRAATRWATGWNAHCMISSSCTPNKDWTDDICGPTPCARVELRKHLAAMRDSEQPLLLWDAASALKAFKLEYRRLQFPTECRVGRYLLIEAFNWGLLSQVRDFGDQLMAAMYYNRTAVLMLPTYEKFANNQESAFLGCQRPYLECFFPAFSSCEYNATMRNKGIDEDAAKKQGARHWPFTAWVIPHTGNYFPEWFWRSLVRKKLVRLHDGTRMRDASATMFHGYSDQLAKSMKTSMLRSLLVATALQPLPQATKMADEILASQTFELPMIAIHIRRTDKTDEDPYYQKMHEFLPEKYFFKIARKLEDKLDITFRSAFIMTDTPDLFGKIKESGVAQKEMRGSPRLLHNNWFSEQKKKRGAEWINQFRGGYKSVSREVKRQYQYSFLAEVFAAARHSSYVIGSGSSGVGQIIAQTIASRVGADPNAFGVWTEDWLKYVVPELAEQADFDHDSWAHTS